MWRWFDKSYNVSKWIANTGKAHAIGEELILLAAKEVLETVLRHSAKSSAIKSVQLSNDTERQRIDEMAEDVEASLCKILMSLQADWIYIAK